MQLDACCIRSEGDSFRLEHGPECHGYVFILAAKELSISLYDRDGAAKPAKHLGELQTDITTSDNDEVFRQDFEIEDGTGRQIGCRFRSFDGHRRSSSDVEKDHWRLQDSLADTDRCGGLKARVTSHQCASLRAGDPVCNTIP